MYSGESIKKLKDTRQRLEFIFELCEEKGGVARALEDHKSSQPAIIMHLVVCKENFEKILFSGENVSEFLSKDDLRGLKAIRNIAAHDYDGLNLALIESVIRDYLPKIKEKIDKFLNSHAHDF